MAICRRTAAREEKWVFFVCLSRLRSVYLWAIGALTVRGILLLFIGRF